MMSSEASGATITPPITTPVSSRAYSLTNPSSLRCILARALVANGRVTTRAGTALDWDAAPMPTVAISGLVNTLAATVFSRSGVTASPSACHIAIRPCIAATEASSSTPVQSPAA